MILPKDAYNSILEYLRESFSFSFLDKIPGCEKKSEIQAEAIIRLIESYSQNKIFLDYSPMILNLIDENFISQLIGLRWEKPTLNSNSQINIIKEDKFKLIGYQNVYFILLLLIIKCIFHSQSTATLPIFNEYKYKTETFKFDVIGTIDFAIGSIISTEPSINTVFLALSAKSIIPYENEGDNISSISRLVNIIFHLSKIYYSYKYQNNDIHTRPMLSSLIINLLSNASFFGLDYNILNALYEKVLIGELNWKN